MRETKKSLRQLAGRRGVVHLQVRKFVEVRVNPSTAMPQYRLSWGEYSMEVWASVSPEYGSRRRHLSVRFRLRPRTYKRAVEMVKVVMRSRAIKTVE